MMDITVTEFFITQGIRARMELDPGFVDFVAESMQRHLRHDWGDTSAEDSLVNDEFPDDAMSTYFKVPGDEQSKIWVKSECGHVIALLPEEY